MRGNLPLAPRRFPPPPLMGRKSAHEPLRVVSRSRERDRRVRAADDRGRGRADALRAREAALLATLRDRGRSPVRRPAHRDVRLAPRAHLVRRLVLALLTDAAGRSRRLDVPAAVDRARRRRGRAAARPRDHESVSETDVLPVLAACALPELRNLAPRAQPRNPGGDRPRRTLGARALHRRRRDRNRPHRLAHERWVAAAGRNPPRTGYLTRRVIPADWKPAFFAVKRTRPRLVGRSVKRATPHMLVVRI